MPHQSWALATNKAPHQSGFFAEAVRLQLQLRREGPAHGRREAPMGEERWGHGKGALLGAGARRLGEDRGLHRRRQERLQRGGEAQRTAASPRPGQNPAQSQHCTGATPGDAVHHAEGVRQD
jgi:hypothetical protein